MLHLSQIFGIKHLLSQSSCHLTSAPIIFELEKSASFIHGTVKILYLKKHFLSMDWSLCTGIYTGETTGSFKSHPINPPQVEIENNSWLR